MLYTASFPALEERIMSHGRTLLNALEGVWISGKGRLGANSAVGQLLKVNAHLN